MCLCRDFEPVVGGLALLIGLGFAGTASAQEQRPDDGIRPARQVRPDEASGSEADRFHAPRDRDFAFPEPDRLRGRSRYRESGRNPERPYPRLLDLRPQFYRDGYGYRFGVPAFDGLYTERFERAYRQGLADGRDYERFEIQAERGLAAYQDAMFSGHAAFTDGAYGLAARQFLLAATLNQGDPASRLCAAHAQTALGDYRPAVRLLRRAFELQPKLVYLPLDIRGAYGENADFAKHRSALRKTTASENNGDLWLLLGYYYYYTNHMSKAAAALSNAVKLQPEDPLAARLAALARMSASRLEPTPGTHDSRTGDRD